MKKSLMRLLSMILTLLIISGMLPVSAVSAISETGIISPAGQDKPQTPVGAAIHPLLSHEEYLKQQLESITLQLDDNDIMKAFGIPLSELTVSKPVAGDVLTIDGGYPGAQGQYIINGGAYAGEDTGTGSRYPLTIRRPKGNDPGVDYPASVDLHAIAPSRSGSAWLYDSAAGYNEVSSITFLPGETSKTIYLQYSTSTTSFGTDGIEPFFVMLSNPFRAKPDYTLLQINFNRTADTSSLNNTVVSLSNAFIMQGHIYPSSNSPYTVGSLVPISVESGSGYGEWWNISSGMALTMGGASLSPLQAGTTGRVATFLYTVTEADVINGYLPEPTSLTGVSLTNNPIGPGPFSYIKSGTPDLQSDLSGAELIACPMYGTVTANKVTYNGAEEVTITVPLINSTMLASFPDEYPLGAGLTEWFKLSLDGGYSFISSANISCAGGVITAKFPAPVNTIQQTVYYAEVFEITLEAGVDVATAIPGAYVSFTVNTTSEIIVPVDSMTITGLPDRNIIRLDGQTIFQLGCDVFPAGATYKGYTWSSSNPAVASVSSSGQLTGITQGTAVITVTSDEFDYHTQNGTTPDLAKLRQSVTINVGNVTSNIITIANNRNPSLGADGSLVIAFISNLHLLYGGAFDIDYEIIRSSDSAPLAAGTINSTSDPEKSFSFGSGSGEIPYAISTYVSGEYRPAYTVTMTAYDPLTNDPVTDTAYVFVYPPRPSVRCYMDWTTHRLNETIKLPCSITGLDGNEFEVKIDVLKGASGGTMVHSFSMNHLDVGSLPGLTKTTNGDLVSFDGELTFTVDDAETYEIIISALNDIDSTGQNADSRSVRIRVADTDAAVDMTIYNALGEIVFNGNPGDNLPVTGVTLSDIASVTETDATPYDSAAAFGLLQKANPYRRVEFSTPAEWLGAKMSIESVVADWGFHVYFPAGREIEATLQWPNIKKDIGLTFFQENFKDKVYVFQFPSTTPSSPVTFSYVNGAGLLQTRVTTLCGIDVNGVPALAAVIYEPYGISGMVKISQTRLVGMEENLFTAIVHNALSAEYAFANTAAVYTHQYFTHDFVRNIAPALTYSATAKIGFVDASFGGIKLPIADSINVNYQIVDSQYQPIQPGGDYAVADLRGSLTVPGSGKAVIEYKPIMDNPDYLLMLEVVSPLYKPHLFIIDYDYLMRATGGQRIDVSLTMPLITRNDNTGVLSISNPIITYKDKYDNSHRVNTLGSADNDTVLFGHTSPKLDVFVLLENDSHKESLANTPGKRLVLTAPIVVGLYAGTLVSLNPAGAAEYDSASHFVGTYGRFIYDLEELPLDKTIPNVFLSMGLINNNNYMAPGSVGNRRIPNMLRSDFDRAEVEEIMNELDIPSPGSPAAGGSVNRLDLNGAQNQLNAGGDVKKVMGDFAIDIPSGGLPFQFQVSRVGNDFEIKGVLSYNAIPGGDMADMFESLQEFETAFLQVKNMIWTSQNNPSDYTADRIRNGGSLFVGFRGYLVGKAVYDPASDSYSIQLSEGGVIAEISGKYSQRIPLAILEIAFGIEGELSAGLILKGPTSAEQQASDAAVKVNFILTNTVRVNLRASIAIGFDIVIASAYAGIAGKGGGSHNQQIVYRPYLADNDPRQMQAGFKTSMEASLVAFVRTDIGCWTVVYEEWPIVRGSVDFYTPNNPSNPYLDTSLSRAASSFSIELMSTATPLGTGYINAFADGLRGNAMARLYNNGTIVAYRDEGDPNEYGDGRILVSSILSHAPEALKNIVTPEEDVETVYGYDLSSFGNKAIAAWETLDEPPTQAQLIGLDIFDILTPMFAKAEISASVNNGTGWSVPFRLSNNGMADISPVAAINVAGDAAVVWSRGEFGISLDNGFSTYVTGDLVCSLYSGGSWSDPIRLLQVPESLSLTSYKAAMDDSGNLIVVVAVLDKNTEGRSIYIISLAASDGTMVVRDICTEGATPDIIWDGTRFVVAYSLDGVIHIGAFIFDSGDMTFTAAEMPADIGAGFRLFRDESKTGIDSLMIMWSGIAIREEIDAESIIYAAKLYERGSVGGIGLTAPIVVGAAPAGLVTSSFDAHLSGNSITAAAVYASPDGGGCIVIERAEFVNSLELGGVYYAAEDVFPGNSLPISFTVYNNGYSPIVSVLIDIDGRSVSVALTEPLMPNKYATVVGLYTVPAVVTTAIYTITANNGSVLSGSLNLSQTDIGVITLSVDETENGAAVLVSLFNASQLTPPAGSKLEVGIYRDIAGEYPAGGSATVANWDTLADADHVLSLSCDKVTEPTLLYVVAKTVGADSNEIYDTNILNNSAAFALAGPRIPDSTNNKDSSDTYDYYPEPPGSGASSSAKDGGGSLPGGEMVDTQKDQGLDNPFADVKAGDWFYNAVIFAYANGLMNGTSASPMLFSPNSPLTRGMIVTVLYRLTGEPNSELTGDNNTPHSSLVAPNFTDVPDGTWYTDAVLWAASVGIVDGYGNGRFGPNDNITRQDLAVILARYADYMGIQLPPNSSLHTPNFIDDADIADYAKDAVERLYKAGIINGYPDGSFKPRGQATRAEFAAMLMRFIESAK